MKTRKNKAVSEAQVVSETGVTEVVDQGLPEPEFAPIHPNTSYLADVYQDQNASEEGHTYRDKADLATIDPTLIEKNLILTNKYGHVACRLSKAGKKLVEDAIANGYELKSPEHTKQLPEIHEDLDNEIVANSVNDATIVPEEKKSQMSVHISQDVPLPERLRASRTAKYPLASLDIGHSFFVANTAEVPDQKKRMTSSVSNANKSLKPKKFIIREVVESSPENYKGPNGELGARVWRSE